MLQNLTKGEFIMTKQKNATRRKQIINATLIWVAMTIGVNTFAFTVPFQEEQNSSNTAFEVPETIRFQILEPEKAEAMADWAEAKAVSKTEAKAEAKAETQPKAKAKAKAKAKKKKAKAKAKAKKKAKAKAKKKAKTKKEKKWEYMGEYLITAYCSCEECNGQWTGQPTASGTDMVEGRTIAVDPDVIPLGSTVKIDGNTYIAEDTGSAVNGEHIDMFLDDHQQTDEWGRQYKDVYLYTGE